MRLARLLTFSAMSAGVVAATADTPERMPLTAADPRRTGASPSVVLLSFSHVIAASRGPAGDTDAFAPAVDGSFPVPESSPSSPSPPVAASILRSYSSYLDPFTVLSASCACTMAFVLSRIACSRLARFRHRNGMCKNVESACRP